MSHMMSVLSTEPLIARLPSLLRLTALTVPECPLKVRIGSPVSTSHRISVLSVEPLMARLSSLAAGGDLFEDSFLGPPGFFRIGGTLYRMEDGLVPAMEFAREKVRQNIRCAFEGLGIKVYVFRDRVESRGFIPTEVMDIPGETGHAMGGAIICSARGSGGWVTKQSLLSYELIES